LTPASVPAAAALAALTAAAAALGALPLRLRRPLPRLWMGWANAVASGLMLGASYVLSEAGQGWPPLATAVGAVAGIVLVLELHEAIGSAELERNLTARQAAPYSRRIFLATLLHAAAEGVALGVALSLDLRLGMLMAVALWVHKVAEGTTLCAVLAGQGVRLRRAAGLALLADLPTVPAAVGALVLIQRWGALTPWLLGLGIGALIYLVMVDLLPEAYRQAGHVSIAVLVSIALGAIVLLEGSLP
jgi:zinc transporter ZupT